MGQQVFSAVHQVFSMVRKVVYYFIDTIMEIIEQKVKQFLVKNEHEINKAKEKEKVAQKAALGKERHELQKQYDGITLTAEDNNILKRMEEKY
jgi:cell shape-determining protein MreC